MYTIAQLQVVLLVLLKIFLQCIQDSSLIYFKMHTTALELQRDEQRQSSPLEAIFKRSCDFFFPLGNVENQF